MTPDSPSSNLRLGILLMIATTFVFATQDSLSRYLAERYNVNMIVMIRFWAFALFVLAIASRKKGGIRATIATRQPWVQLIRCLVLVSEIVIMIYGFVALGLIESHAIFASYPLMIAAMSGPLLGEKVGWRRWGAILIGFVGILLILKPGGGVFSTAALIPLFASFLFAVYGLLTRYVARQDSSTTSFVWTGLVGAVAMTIVGIWSLEPMTWGDAMWMAMLCCTGLLGHWMLIRAYEVAEASAVQPFAYLQLVFGAFYGVMVFGEVLRPNVAIGALIVVSAGIFTLLRTRKVARKVTPVTSRP